MSLPKHIIEHAELGYPDASKVGGPLSILDEGVLIQSKVTGINFTGSHVVVTASTGTATVEIDFSANIDGGNANSVYLPSQVIDGGNAFN